MKTTTLFNQFTRRAKTRLVLLSIITALGAASAVQGASLSELLEQGIYSEQTKGDLDGAMQAYRQVVQDTKAGEALAAQAQYRLGVCLYKKKDYAGATAAFEQLVADYPNQKDFVKLANEYLAGATVLLPAPWVDGEELRMDVKLGSGFKIGVARYTVDADELDGRKIWRISSHLYAGVQQLSRVAVEADSFKPIQCRWKHTLLGDSYTVYSPGKAEVTLKGKDDKKILELEGAIYDNEQALALMRRLPLATNYTTALRIFAGLGGGHIIPLKLDVVALESVKTPAGTFDCYKVELSIKQTFWYSADEHRYLVKFEGGGVIAELSEIRQRKPGQPETYRDSVVSVSAPAGWLFFPQKTVEKDKILRLVALDPDASANTVLTTANMDSFKPEEKSSLRAVAEKAVGEAKKNLKDFQVRPDSWTDTTLDGQPALSILADFKDGEESQIATAIFTIAGDRAIELHMHAPSGEFEALRPQFATIVKSLKLN
jgi:tetratricopeptide (TPR) repeat protein